MGADLSLGGIVVGFRKNASAGLKTDFLKNHNCYRNGFGIVG
jgi:hypothetical protein